MNRRLLYIPVLHIDTNLINARQKLDAVNKLERWFEDEVILINISSIAHGEAKADSDERRTRKANQQIYTTTAPIANGATVPAGRRCPISIGHIRRELTE